MDAFLPALSAHPAGEQPSVEDWSATADTFGGRAHVEWDSGGLVTPLGQLPFFIEYLKQAGLFRLGGGLPTEVQQSERPVQARLAGDSAAVGSVGPLPLCPHHDTAVRRGEPAAAGHEEGNERRRGASWLVEDRRGGWPEVAADASGLLRLAAAERAVGARHR